ncbi:uncharacterized protein LOC110840110, partial [Zootermopsis nevadensis]|uniref:uncharacterized protein LOC110840110 n=1 Tax=Zootermopsis nevadensis TaxID=136037 RepID=UPI000B8E7BDB
SCLSYGHSCWGAHGKRSGNVAADEAPVDVSEAVAAIAAPEDTRWFLSKLVRQAEPVSGSKVWKRLRGVRVPSAADRRRNEVQWRNGASEEEDEAEATGGNDAVARSRTIHLEGSEETPAGILVPAGGEYPAGENQDAEVLLMADDQAIRRTPQKLRVYKLMNHQGGKLD